LLIGDQVQDLNFTGYLPTLSPFPHGTFSLSLNAPYLALVHGCTIFNEVISPFTCIVSKKLIILVNR